jgi:hypothetical protein
MATRRQQQSKGYKVGYGRPPKQHRFQKGKSGNPTGKNDRPHRSQRTYA